VPALGYLPEAFLKYPQEYDMMDNVSDFVVSCLCNSIGKLTVSHHQINIQPWRKWTFYSLTL
jgi:hypothetical protein